MVQNTVDAAPRPMMKISWQSWDEAVRGLATSIRNHPNRNAAFPKQLIGISRGGVIVAAQLSHLLDIPYYATIHAHAYKKNGFMGEVRQDKVTFFGAPQLAPSEIMTSLFCDDIVDTALTIEELSIRYHDARFVCPVGRVPGINKAGNKLYVNPPITVWDERWIEFPWESALPTPNKPMKELDNAV